MGNGIVREAQDIENFKKFSNEYDRMRMAGLNAEEIHGILCARIQKTQSIISNDIIDFSDMNYAQQTRLPESTNTTPTADRASSSSTDFKKPMKQTMKSVMETSTSIHIETSKPQKAKTVGLALLIDDSAVAAKVATKILVLANFDVVTASSAKMGFDILLGRKDEINVIFLDVVMPNVDGVECLSWIKDNADVSHMPVYMLSGLEDQMLSEVCIERGAEGMLLKPLRLETVKTIIRSHGIGGPFESINNSSQQESKNAPPSSSISRPTPLKEDSVPREALIPNSSSSSQAVHIHNEGNKTKKVATSGTLPHPYSGVANAPPPNTTMSGLVPAFKLVDSDFAEYVYPSTSGKKLTLLLFIPTVYCPALYEEDGFLMRFFQNYDLLMHSKQVNVACISGDLPFSLSAAKQRFRIPFSLLSDPSLFVTQKLVGAINVGPILAYQELLQRHVDDEDENNEAEHSKLKDKEQLDDEVQKQVLSVATHSQQMFYGPRLSMLLLNRRREVLNMWMCQLPHISKQILSLDPKEVNFRQFPSNFKEWIIQVSNAGTNKEFTDKDDLNGSETTKQRVFSNKSGNLNQNVKKETTSKNSILQQGHTETKERDREADNHRGKGTKDSFSHPPVSIPALLNENALIMKKPVEKTAILVIDDSSVSSRVVCRKLESLGYVVHAAYDGQKGYDMLRKQTVNFSIILCDVVMPICDGMGFLKLVKSDEETKHIPVVMLSGLEGEELSKNCMDLGAYSLFKKPFDEQKFSEILLELGIPQPSTI